LIQSVSVFSHAVPLRPLGGEWADFSVGEDPTERAQWWLDRMAASSILGICPISALLSPEFSLERMTDLAVKAVAWEDLTGEQIRRQGRRLVKETHSLGDREGTLPPSWVSADLDSALQKLREGWEE
jgi:hypothetical protein